MSFEVYTKTVGFDGKEVMARDQDVGSKVELKRAKNSSPERFEHSRAKHNR